MIVLKGMGRGTYQGQRVLGGMGRIFGFVAAVIENTARINIFVRRGRR